MITQFSSIFKFLPRSGMINRHVLQQTLIATDWWSSYLCLLLTIFDTQFWDFRLIICWWLDGRESSYRPSLLSKLKIFTPSDTQAARSSFTRTDTRKKSADGNTGSCIMIGLEEGSINQREEEPVIVVPHREYETQSGGGNMDSGLMLISQWDFKRNNS